ncbi:MAG: diaminopimelate epimerase [Candidatus Omnitrophota bacterium]
MAKIDFTKMVASGNDFVIIEARPQSIVHSPQSLAKRICDRKYGVGADGLLVLEKSKVADIRMRIFNADGSEAEMCGNGARCVALYLSRNHQVTLPVRQAGRSPGHQIETKAGIVSFKVNKNDVSIKLTEPKNIKLDLPIKVNNHTLKVNFIDTGVPHTVIFVEGLDKIDVGGLGRKIRYHKAFVPRGTNVDFVELIDTSSIRIRTYERGVEDETLSCGTGIVAAALIAGLKLRAATHNTIKVYTQSEEILNVYFERVGNNFRNIWLKGKVCSVFEGQWRM